MAYIIIQPMTFDLWNWGGSSGKVRVFASQSFYEATTGQFIPQGQVTNFSSACQVLNATVSGQDFTIPEITLATTTDSTVQNATFTVVLYDQTDVARFTLLNQGFIDPAYMQEPPQPSVIVTLAGNGSFNGTYDYAGQLNGRPYYNATGDDLYSIKYVDTFWRIYNDADEAVYASEFETEADFPWEIETWVTTGFGTPPAPTVTEDEFLFTATWEQVTLSNQAAATAGLPFQFQGPFWDVSQTKLYVNSVVGGSGSALPFASNVTAGKTKLDAPPATATDPIAIGVNSPTIATIQSTLTSLNTLKAPKASPTFTGTVTVTGNIAATTTIAATGNVTGANLSNTNTGNVTVTGQNYLSIGGTGGQVLTANPVNLSGANVTGTLAAARFPALTGDVTNSAGSLATTIANDAVTTVKILNANVTNAKVATRIDAAKLADGSVSNAKFQFIGTLTSNAQTQLTTLSTDKANIASPTFTGTPLAPTAAAGTSTTQIATTAFVQGLGLGAKVYMATLTQSSTSTPVATVLNNTLGGTLVWARTGTGVYTGTFASPFTANKTQVFIGSVLDGVSYFGRVKAVRTSSSVITVSTAQVDVSGGSIVPADDELSETAISIIIGA